MNEITVAITTVGRPDFLRTALQSVRNQTNREAIGEIVVSENNSDRRTEQVVREFPDLPIRYLFREPSLPMLEHLFSTFRQARTPYLAVLNDDDWWSAGHLAQGLSRLEADAEASAYAAASLFVIDEASKNPRWIDRSAAVWLVARNPSWVTTWTLDTRQMLALCWVYTPFHISSMIARTQHILPVLDELQQETYHTHTIDRLAFARLSLRGTFHYNPVPDTFVRWHASNWIKKQAPEAVQEVVRSTVRLIEGMDHELGSNVIELWKERLASVPSGVELEVLDRFREAFTAQRLEQLGLSRFFRTRPPSCRFLALRSIAAGAKRLVLGCS
jgi:glycosyltransferase involved in cell wall biosynthesis